MIVVDTSALMAIAQDEPHADRCAELLSHQDTVLISAGTLAETLIVAARRNATEAMDALLAPIALEVVPVTAPFARAMAAAYSRWGKGVHPAALNLGGCFAYTLAKERDCALLYVGDDFARTDIVSALG